MCLEFVVDITSRYYLGVAVLTSLSLWIRQGLCRHWRFLLGFLHTFGQLERFCFSSVGPFPVEIQSQTSLLLFIHLLLLPKVFWCGHRELLQHKSCKLVPHSFYKRIPILSFRVLAFHKMLVSLTPPWLTRMTNNKIENIIPNFSNRLTVTLLL